MKRIIVILLLAWCGYAAPSLIVAPPTGNVMLFWNYDTNLLSTNLWFNIYETTNLLTPLTNRNCLTNVVGTNLTVADNINPGAHFIRETASNIWGESAISTNVFATPPLPLPINDSFSIRKVP
jgi:hypothetical protein